MLALHYYDGKCGIYKLEFQFANVYYRANDIESSIGKEHSLFFNFNACVALFSLFSTILTRLFPIVLLLLFVTSAL